MTLSINHVLHRQRLPLCHVFMARLFGLIVSCSPVSWLVLLAAGAGADDHLAQLQAKANEAGVADWGHWGPEPNKYSSSTYHTNRLVPVYTFGIGLDSWRREGSPYRDPERLTRLYGRIPDETHQPEAEYFDQTQIYSLQKAAIAAGKKYLVLMVFDGMDWQTTQAAAIVRSRKIYQAGRGSGLAFQDYRGVKTDYGYVVTSPYGATAEVDVDAQLVISLSEIRGGYSPLRGGFKPWQRPREPNYLAAESRDLLRHGITDSAASATAMTAGVKTNSGTINISPDGKHLEPISRWLQRTKGFRVGVVTSVPISHATPAAAYANNISREDYQDLTRDLLGLASISHKTEPLPGVDVLIGAGFGVVSTEDENQGANLVPGNRFLTAADAAKISSERGGRFQVAMRTSGRSGRRVLKQAAESAIQHDRRLFGFFGFEGGHFPFQTADGDFHPVKDTQGLESYTLADVEENPTLAECTRAALAVLGQDERSFWLMIEAGDVDWANHANNLDSSVGTVFSGEAAFNEVTQWAESRGVWDELAIIVTSDHGHYFVLTDPKSLISDDASERPRP